MMRHCSLWGTLLWICSWTYLTEAVVRPRKFMVEVSSERNVTLWTDLDDQDLALVYGRDKTLRFGEPVSLSNHTTIDVVAADHDEDILFVLECMDDAAETVGSKLTFAAQCLCYYAADLLVRARNAPMYHCASSISSKKVLSGVAQGLRTKGEWRNVIHVGDSGIIQGWDEGENSPVIAGSFGCDYNPWRIAEIANNVHFLGDYVNVIIDCPFNTTDAIMRQLHEISKVDINYVSYNFLLLDVTVGDFARLYNYTRDGDDVVIPEVDFFHIPIRNVFRTSLMQSEDTFSPLATTTLHWCVAVCFKGADKFTATRPFHKMSDILDYYAIMLPNDFLTFYGRHIRVVCESYKPFCYHEMINGTAVYFGVEVEIVHTLSEQFNFTYSIGPSYDGNWGVADKNGFWNGMVGMVHREEADIAVAGITITTTRDSVIDFLYPHFESPSAVIFKLQQFKWFYFIKPFAYYMWVTVLCVPLFVSVFVTFIHLVHEFSMGSFYDDHHSRRRSDDAWIWTSLRRIAHIWTQNVFLIFGCQVMQGNIVPGKSHSIRMMMGSFWLVTIMVVAIYAGNLTASLAVNDVRMPFETLDELAANDEYVFQIERGTFREQLFREAEHGAYQRLWDKMMRDYDRSVIDSSQVAKDNVLLGGHTYTGSKIGLIEFIREIEDCDLVLLKEEYYKAGFGVVVKQGMPFKKHYDYVVESLADAGILQRWIAQHSTSDTCSVQDTTVSSALTISDISLVMEMLLGVPLAMACSILLLEVIVRRVKVILAARRVRPKLAGVDEIKYI